MKRCLLLLLLVTGFQSARAQLSMIYENSFRNWATGQGWVILDSDAIPETVNIVNRSVTNGIPPTTEIMDYMLGVMGQTGAADLVYMTPPIVLGNHSWAQFYSFKNAVSFSAWVVPDANNPTLAGMTDSLVSLNADGFNNIDLSAYANTTIRLAFKITGNNPTAYIDDLKIFEKHGLAAVPDNDFRAYLQSIVPAAFVGDSLDYTSNAVTGCRRILHPNGTIASLEGLQYFVFLKKIDLSNNNIGYFPPNRLPYLDTLIVPHNHISVIPDIPVARYLDYSYNVAINFPDFRNQQCAWLIANNNLIVDCLQGTNRFVKGSILNNIATYKASYTYYYLQYVNTAPTFFNCSQSTAKVHGQVFFDANQNGIRDIGELLLSNQTVVFTQGVDMVTNNVGQYGTSAEAGSFTIAVLPPAGFTCEPLDTVLAPGDVLHHDFPVVGAATPYSDAAVVLSGINDLPGNTPLGLTMLLLNGGNGTETVTGKLPIPTGTAVLSSTSGTVVGDTLFWSATLTPFQSAVNHISLSVNGLATGQNHTFLAIASLAGDANPANNTDLHTVFIRDTVPPPPITIPLPPQFPPQNPPFNLPPYDPNNKLVSTPVVDTNFQDYLYYTINFENIGAGNATYVTVRDKLSPMLDHTSFQYLGSTHPCIVSYALDSIVQFTFDPIVLTPTSVDSLHSKGTIWFRIKPDAPLQVGDTIFNSASIVFNTNTPIITNVSTVHVDPLRDAEFTHLTGTEICGSDTVWFHDLSTAQPLSWEWYFEGADQTTSTQKYPHIVYSTAGTYDVKLITHWADGHTDTIVKQDYVVVSPTAELAEFPSFCQDETAYTLAEGLPAGGTYSGANVAAGVFDLAAAGPGQHTVTYVYDNGNGCVTSDSKVLTVNPHYAFPSTYQTCEGETYTWQGTDYTVSGSYTASYTTASGCDSVYTLELVVAPLSQFTETHTICEGDSYNWQGSDYATAGTYTAAYSSVNGCDSTYTLQLIVTPMDYAETHAMCDGESYTWQGTTYTTADTYTAVYTNVNGCDSTYTLQLMVNPVSSFLEDAAICAGETFSWQGNDYTAAGTYTMNYVSLQGCDSTYTLTLVTGTPFQSAESYAMCEGETYLWHGQELVSGGTYTASYAGMYGCDSTYTLTLVTGTPFQSAESYAICEGETYLWHGQELVSDGTYIASYAGMYGCDSTYTLELTVHTTDVSVNLNDPVITANAAGASYQWLSCENGYVPVIGQNGQTFSPVANGDYAVIVTQNGCSDTSECVTVSSLGMEDLATAGLLIYPNPATDELTIRVPGNETELSFALFNATGQLVLNGTVKEQTIIAVGGFAPGVYTLRLERDGIPVMEKIVKQ